MTLKVGDVVTVGRACLSNPAGALAVVVKASTLRGFRAVHQPGWMLLFENGHTDGFSPRDCELFQVALESHDLTLAGYVFQNVLALDRDWRAGRFDRVWATTSALRLVP